MTLRLAVFRGFPWKRDPIYLLSQTSGACLGALLVYSNYMHAILIVDPHKTRLTSSLFVPYTLDYLPAGMDSSIFIILVARLLSRGIISCLFLLRISWYWDPHYSIICGMGQAQRTAATRTCAFGPLHFTSRRGGGLRHGDGVRSQSRMSPRRIAPNTTSR